MRDLLPTDITMITLSSQSPASFFETERQKTPEQRTAILCVDARSDQPSDVTKWINQYNESLQQELDKPADAVDPWLVVVVTPDSTPAPEWIKAQINTNPAIDIVETVDTTTAPEDLYRQTIQKDLSNLYISPPTKGLEPDDDPNAKPIENFIPQDELDDWRARLKELETRDD